MTDLIGEKILYNTFLIIVAIFLSLLWNLLWAFPLMWAWNYTIPYIFGLPVIGWLHSFLLLFILESLWKLRILHGK